MSLLLCTQNRWWFVKQNKNCFVGSNPSTKRIFLWFDKEWKKVCSERESCLFKYCGIIFELVKLERRKHFTHDFGTANVRDLSETFVLLSLRPASDAMGDDSRLLWGGLSWLRELRRCRPHRTGDWSGATDETFARRDDGQRKARKLWEWWSATPLSSLADPSSLSVRKHDDTNATSTYDGFRSENRENWATWS